MAAGTYNIEIEQGADWGRTMTITEEGVVLDLSEYNFAGKIRKEKSSATAMTSFTIQVTNAAAGIIYVSLANVITSGLTAGTAYYDIEMTRDDSTIVRLLEGVVDITTEVTR